MTVGSCQVDCHDAGIDVVGGESPDVVVCRGTVVETDCMETHLGSSHMLGLVVADHMRSPMVSCDLVVASKS